MSLYDDPILLLIGWVPSGPHSLVVAQTLHLCLILNRRSLFPWEQQLGWLKLLFKTCCSRGVPSRPHLPV